MAGDAIWFFETGIMRKAFDVGMAIHAGKHRAVNGGLECIAVHPLAVHHGRIVMACKAIVVG
jgi:hypothetical protein